ncbi:MAG: AzlD domain-containing protein [Nitriliruptor sp.]
MNATTVALLVLAGGTYAMKAVGPVLAAGRQLPPVLARAADLLQAALLAALVATQTVGAGTTITLDARAIGVGVAALAVWRGLPFGVVVVLGAGVTALARLAGVA